MKNLNLIGELKRNCSLHKEDFIKKRNRYFMALANHQVVMDIDEQSKKEALTENAFYSAKGERILLSSSDYRIKKADFKTYLKFADEKRKQKGLILPYYKYEWAKKEPFNLSSDCESRELLFNAKKDFLKVALKVVPTQWKDEFGEVVEKMKYPYADKFLELTLKLDVEGGL